MATSKRITVSGVNEHMGFSRLFVDVIREDGSLVDTFREESLALTFEELWQKYGRRAVRQLKAMYAVTDVSKPSACKR